MSFDTLTTTMKLYYEDQGMMGKQIDEVLFPSLDESAKATVKVDDYTGQPFTARAIVKGQPANIRNFVNGTGNEYEPPIVKEKTPIDEELDDSVIVGNDPTAPASQQMMDLVTKIIDGPKGHVIAHKMARAKAAIDVFRIGVFSLPLENGGTIEFDFGRNESLDITADLSSVTFDQALLAMYKALNPFGFPQGNIGLLAGQSWFSRFQSDEKVLEKRKATNAAALIQERMNNPFFQGAEGLYDMGMYNVDGMASPVRILTYSPDWPYLAKEGGNTSPYLPADEAVMFNIGGIGWRINRGVTVKDGQGRKSRQVGDIVFDTFGDDDPVVDWLRSNARFMYIKGNINHTCRSKGSNF